MTTAHPTATQARVLVYLHAAFQKEDAIPHGRAVAERFGWSSTTAAWEHLHALEKKGYIERNAFGGWRFPRKETPMTQPEPVMTDEEREEAIKAAGDLIVQKMEVWDKHGCFAARGDAIAAEIRQRALIKGRSPEQVARMEAERGLR